MSKVYVINRKQVAIAVTFAVLLVLTAGYVKWSDVRAASTAPVAERAIHLVTGEYTTTTASGKKIESYRFDPGTVFVKEGEAVQLVMYGVSGDDHPFTIEGTTISGVIRKGEETIVHFKADEEGTYRIICSTHPPGKHDGPPMIGYIVVD